jgi:Na+-driven multidrug efflux pump
MDPSEQQNFKYEQMTRAPVEKLVCTLAVPSIIIMMISALYNMADTYFVSFLGTSAIAGVGVVFPLMSLIQALGFVFGHGSGNCIARETGARRAGRASRMAAAGFITALLTGAALLNIVLDPLVIFVFNMGVRGAALAAMISQFVGCALLFIIMRGRGDVPVRFGDFCPRPAVYREMARGGSPLLPGRELPVLHLPWLTMLQGFTETPP